MHQPGAGGKRRPRRQSQRPAHPGVASHHHDPATIALVVAGSEPPQPLGCLNVADHDRPLRVGCRMSDVDNGNVTHFVPGQQLAAAKASEGDGEIGLRDAVHHPGEEVYTGRSIHRHDWYREIVNPSDQGRDRRPRRSGGAGAKQGVHRQSHGRPWPIGRDLADSLSRERAWPFARRAPSRHRPTRPTPERRRDAAPAR